MSNTQAPNGFSQLGLITGSVPNYAMNTYSIAYNNTHQIGFGDVVEQLSDGTIDIASGSTSLILGVFQGCQYFDTAQNKTVYSNWWPAPSTASSGTVFAKVIDDPNAEFLVQAGGTVPALTLADVGANVTYGGNGAPNTLSGVSTAYIDASTKNTTNTLAFRITGLGQNVNNDVASNYDWVRVKMNYQAYNQTTGV